MFAYAAGVGKSKYSVEDRPAILVSLAEEMNIVVPETSVPARYIDVRLKNIERVTMMEISGRNKFAITLALVSKPGDSTLLFNARERFDHSISIAFDDPEDAQELQDFIVAKQRGFAGLPKVSESEIIIDLTRRKPPAVNTDESSNVLPKDDGDPESLKITANQAVRALRERSLSTHTGQPRLENRAGILDRQLQPAEDSDGNVGNVTAPMSQQNEIVDCPSKPVLQPTAHGHRKDNNASSKADESQASSPNMPPPARTTQFKPPVQNRLRTEQESPPAAREIHTELPVQEKRSTNQRPQKATKAPRGGERKPPPVAKISYTDTSSKNLKQHTTIDPETKNPDNVDWDEGLSVPRDSPAYVPPRAKVKGAKSKGATSQIPLKKIVSKKASPPNKAQPVPARSQAPTTKSRAKNKQPPIASRKPRSTRAAAIAANSRMQGIDDSEAENASQIALDALNKQLKEDKSTRPGTSSSRASRSSKGNTASLHQSVHDAVESSEATDQVRVKADSDYDVTTSEKHSLSNVRPSDAESEELRRREGSDVAPNGVQPSQVVQGKYSGNVTTPPVCKETEGRLDETQATKPYVITKSEESYADELETGEANGTGKASTDAQFIVKSDVAAGNKAEYKKQSLKLHRHDSLTHREVDKVVHEHADPDFEMLHNDGFIDLREDNSAVAYDGKPPLQDVQRDQIERCNHEIEVRNHFFEDAMAFTDHRSDIDDQHSSHSQGLNATALPLPSNPNLVPSMGSQTHVEIYGSSKTTQAGPKPPEPRTESQNKESTIFNQATLTHAGATNVSTRTLPIALKGPAPAAKPFVGDILQNTLAAFENIDNDRHLALEVKEFAQEGTKLVEVAQGSSIARTQPDLHDQKLLQAKKEFSSAMKGANSVDNNTPQPKSAPEVEKVAVTDLLNVEPRQPQAEVESETVEEPHINSLLTPSKQPKGSSQGNAIHITSSRKDTSQYSSENISPEESAAVASVIERVKIRSYQRTATETPITIRQPPDGGDDQHRESRVLNIIVEAEDAGTIVQNPTNNIGQQIARSKSIPPATIPEAREPTHPKDIENLDGQTDKLELIGEHTAVTTVEQRNAGDSRANSKHQQARAKERIVPRPNVKIDTTKSFLCARTTDNGHPEWSIKTPADPDRKSTLISFDAKGPRNQGLSSTPKPRSENSLAASMFGRQNMEAVRVKRKHQGENVDVKSDQGPKLSNKRAKVLVPEKVLQVKERSNRRSSSGIALSQRNSSQGTRVTEDGSPMPNPVSSQHTTSVAIRPLRHIRPIDIPKLELPAHDGITSIQGNTKMDLSHPRLSAEESEADQDLFLPETKRVQTPPRPGVTFASHNKFEDDQIQNNQMQCSRTQPVKQKKSFVRGDPWAFSSSSKAQPSSPSAPSQMLATMEVFQQESGGKFINVQTEHVVRAQPPRNPFVGIEHERPTSFMERLRRSRKEMTQPQRNAAISDHAPAHHVSHRSAIVFDTEKTLVEDDLPDRENRSRRYRGSTSSSRSSSSRTTKVSESSEQSEEDTEADTVKKWREALRPHQKETFAALTEINHVSLTRHIKLLSFSAD